MMLRIILVVLLSFSSLSQAESAAAWDVHQLMREMSQVSESKGKFVEHKYMAILNRPLESSGTLLFRAPDHVEKNTLKPKIESVVFDHGVLTVENPARNLKRTLVVQEYPAVWALVESIRATLAGDLPALSRFYRIELNGDAAHWKMRLLPLDAKTSAAVREIFIIGRGQRVDSFETIEPNGDHALLQVLEDAP
jgi:outer membrane lipoprotein-sorting protein